MITICTNLNSLLYMTMYNFWSINKVNLEVKFRFLSYLLSHFIPLYLQNVSIEYFMNSFKIICIMLCSSQKKKKTIARIYSMSSFDSLKQICKKKQPFFFLRPADA